MKSIVWVLQFFLFLITVSAEDYLSDMDDSSSNSNTRNYTPTKSSSSSSSTLNNAVESNSGGYAETPLNIPTVPSLPPPPSREIAGNSLQLLFPSLLKFLETTSGGCGGGGSSSSNTGSLPYAGGGCNNNAAAPCGGLPMPCGGGISNPYGQSFPPQFPPYGLPYGGGPPYGQSPCGGGFSRGFGSPCGGGMPWGSGAPIGGSSCGGGSPCGSSCGGGSPCGSSCGGGSPCGSPCGGGSPCGSSCGGGPPCGSSPCGGCQAMRPCLPRPPLCPPPCPMPAPCPIPLPCQPPPRPPMIVGGCGSGGGCGGVSFQGGYGGMPQNDCCCNCQRPCSGGFRARARGIRIGGQYSNVEDNSAKCNSIRLREIIKEGITNDVDESKRNIQKIAQQKFGKLFNVICGTGEFSYITHTQLFCQFSMQRVTCYAFQLI